MRRIVPLSGLAALLLTLWACGDADAPRTLQSQSLGATMLGAPTAAPATDLGILADQTSYKAAQLPGAGGGTGAGGGVTGTSDAVADVSQLVGNLVKSIRDHEMDAIFRAFDPEHVAVVDDTVKDAVFATFDKIDILISEVDAKGLETAKVKELKDALHGVSDARPKVEVIDTERATVSPNPLLVLLGPAAATPALTAVRKDNEWKLQFAAPLAADQVKAIVEYHATLQAALDKLVEAVTKRAKLDATALQSAVTAVLSGQPFDLGPEAAGGTDEGAPKPGVTVPEGGDEKPGTPGDEPKPEEPKPEEPGEQP